MSWQVAPCARWMRGWEYLSLSIAEQNISTGGGGRPAVRAAPPCERRKRKNSRPRYKWDNNI
jgi:hypothetical protein